MPCPGEPILELDSMQDMVVDNHIRKCLVPTNGNHFNFEVLVHASMSFSTLKESIL